MATSDVVSISNMKFALKFKLGKECQALSAALTILSKACLQQTRAPKHVVQLLTLTRSYFIAFELHFLGTMEFDGAVPDPELMTVRQLIHS